MEWIISVMHLHCEVRNLVCLGNFRKSLLGESSPMKLVEKMCNMWKALSGILLRIENM